MKKNGKKMKIGPTDRLFHDLRNLFTVTLLHIEMLMNERSAKERKENARHVKDAIKKMIHLLDDFDGKNRDKTKRKV